MVEETLVSLSAVVVLGITAQWLGWRMRMPSILLLIFGILAGPVLGWISPDEMLGPLLYPVVSLAVGDFVRRRADTFTRGISRHRRCRPATGDSGHAGWLADYFTGGFLGARPVVATCNPARGRAGGDRADRNCAHAPACAPDRPERGDSQVEGIVIDPIGAMLAVLVFQAIVLSETEAEPVALSRSACSKPSLSEPAPVWPARW